MKTSLKTLILLLIVTVSPLKAEDYVITINGTSTEIGLNKETTLVLTDGTSLKLTLQGKEFMRFTGDLFSFEHKSEYKPSRTDLGDGVLQTFIATSLGTGIMVQEYMQMDPTNLVDMMLKEVTKEDVGNGRKCRKTAARKKVGGITFNGKQAVTKSPEEEWTFSILSYGGKDKGLLVFTFIEKENYEKDKDLIERFWASMQLKANLK